MTILARDHKEFAFAEAKFDCRVELCPDMAFAIGTISAPMPEADYACLLRTDKEVLQPKIGEIEAMLKASGDVQAVGDITELVAHDVKPGFIAAGNEFLWLCENDIGPFWRRHRAYLDEIGVNDPHDYFNSGVLAFRMDTWREMASMTLDYFRRFPERSIYHDQSALNAVFYGKWEILSPIYYFGTEFAKLGPIETETPRILHFTGAQKPWHFTCPPWNGRFIADYADFLRKRPILQSLTAGPSSAELAVLTEKLLRSPRRSKLITPWRPLHRRRKFRRYMDSRQLDVG